MALRIKTTGRDGGLCEKKLLENHAMGKMKKAATFRRTTNFSDCDVSSTMRKTTYKCLHTYADMETHCLSEGHQHRGMFFLVFGYS